MIWTVLTMVLGIVLWAALAPASWQMTLQDWADDLYTLVVAWAREAWRKLRERF